MRTKDAHNSVFNAFAYSSGGPVTYSLQGRKKYGDYPAGRCDMLIKFFAEKMAHLFRVGYHIGKGFVRGIRQQVINRPDCGIFCHL